MAAEDPQFSQDMIVIQTQYFSNIQKLQNYVRSLERGLSKLEAIHRQLQQNSNIPIPQNKLQQFFNGGMAELGACVTVNHCLMSMFNRLYDELIRSMQMKDDSLREKSDECQELRTEREDICRRIEQKEDNIEQMKLRVESLNEELVNLREYKEDAATNLLVLQQELVKLQSELDASEQEKADMTLKSEAQDQEVKRITSLNEQLSDTLAENTSIIQKLVQDAETQASYIRELHSVRETNEDVNEQLQKALQKCQEENEQLDRDNTTLVDNLLATTRQYQQSMDRASRLQDTNGLLRNRVSLLETTKETLELNLWDTNRKLDESERTCSFWRRQSGQRATERNS